jgi:pyruvate kinase
MIARGDLFVELPRARLPRLQAELIRRCRALATPSIVATGLLLSMQRSPTPARSEVCDVAAALTVGADSLMLSDETSNSQHPVEAVTTLAELIAEYGGGT